MNSPPQNPELLSAYLDGELSLVEKEQVEQWLASSIEARALLEGLRAVGDRIRELPREELGEGFAPQVLRAIESREVATPVAARRRVLRPAWAWWLGSGAVAAGLLAVAMLALRSSRERLEVAQGPAGGRPGAESGWSADASSSTPLAAGDLRYRDSVPGEARRDEAAAERSHDAFALQAPAPAMKADQRAASRSLPLAADTEPASAAFEQPAAEREGVVRQRASQPGESPGDRPTPAPAAKRRGDETRSPFGVGQGQVAGQGIGGRVGGRTPSALSKGVGGFGGGLGGGGLGGADAAALKQVVRLESLDPEATVQLLDQTGAGIVEVRTGNPGESLKELQKVLALSEVPQEPATAPAARESKGVDDQVKAEPVPATADALYVEASAAQLQAAMKDLKSAPHRRHFSLLAIQAVDPRVLSDQLAEQGVAFGERGADDGGQTAARIQAGEGEVAKKAPAAGSVARRAKTVSDEPRTAANAADSSQRAQREAPQKDGGQQRLLSRQRLVRVPNFPAIGQEFQSGKFGRPQLQGQSAPGQAAESAERSAELRQGSRKRSAGEARLGKGGASAKKTETPAASLPASPDRDSERDGEVQQPQAFKVLFLFRQAPEAAPADSP